MKIKEDLYAWYQGVGYEEGFGPNEVFSFQQKRSRIDTYTIISAFEHSERQKLFGENGDTCAPFFNSATCAFADIVNQLSQLPKALMHACE